MRKVNKKQEMNANTRKSEKENNRKADKMDENAKRKLYNTVRPKKVLRNIKNSATRSISNVKNNLSMRMKRLSPTSGSDKRYEKLANNRTPLKLYSPFHIESPSDYHKPNRSQKRRPCDRQMFLSPMTKMKEDLNYVTESINEMNLMSEQILNNRSLLSN